MITIRFLAPSLLSVVLVSCASQPADQYDTGNAYDTSTTAAAQATPATTAPSNPVYDTPPAYEESTATPGAAAAAASVPDAVAPAHATHVPAASIAADNGPATLHTVVKGDTLSGISKKYKVSVASIKKANHMTNDTVVLGRKIVIPPQ
jgi:LysM repeat protein